LHALESGRRRVFALAAATALGAGGLTAVSAAPAHASSGGGQFAYVAIGSAYNSTPGLAVVDATTGSLIASVPLPNPAESVAVNPAGTQVFATTSGGLVVFDTASDSIVDTIAAAAGSDVVFNPSGTQAYVADPAGSGSVLVLDTATDTVVDTIAGGGNRVAVNPSGTRVYSINSSGSMTVIDTSTDTVVDTVSYGQGGADVAVNPAGTEVFVADLHSLDVFDTATDARIATIPIEGFATGVAVNSAGTLAYVTSAASGQLSVVDTGTNTVVRTSLLGGNPVAVAVSADGTKVYDVEYGSVMTPNGALTISDAASGTQVGGTAFSSPPNDVALGPAETSTPTSTSLTVSPSGTVVQGTTVALTATVTPELSGTVQFYDTTQNGIAAVGSPVAVSNGAASFNFATTQSNIGTNAFSAVFSPSQAGYRGSVSPTATVNVDPPGVNVDHTFVREGNGTVTTFPFSTDGPRLLVAFTSSDGPSAAQSTTVSGAGLTWTLVRRANKEGGTAEIWSASATGPLTNATVTSTPAHGGFDQFLSVYVFFGASGIGASAAAGTVGSTPHVSVTTTKPGSMVFGVGEDYTNAVTPSPGSGQLLDRLWSDTGAGETFWIQSELSAVQSAGTVVALNDSPPSGDAWNMAAAEVLASGS
jgi:YVTN family beta-propeller protein